jgi:hippurate hydrolase
MIEQRLPSSSARSPLPSVRAPVKYERFIRRHQPRRRRARRRRRQSLVGAENVLRNLEPSMGAEDFSFMLQAKPGACAAGRAAPTMAASCTAAATTSTTA